MATGQLTPTGMPIIEIEVTGIRLEAVIDTGFEGGLQLPDSWLARLSPRPYRLVNYQLPYGRTFQEVTYLIPVTLEGLPQPVEVLFSSASDEILLGVDALRDYRLVIDFPAGTVAVDRAVP